MPSRQDQLHSYQYSQQRVVAALVTHDPDPHRSALRRAGMTALVSLVIAALAVGTVAIYGVLTGADGGRPTNEATVYVEKGTGARFVYNATERRLHPVLNYSSALLIANGQAPQVRGTSAKELARIPLGVPLGIPGAPDSLPPAAGLLTGRWSVCTQLPPGGTTPTGTLLVATPLTDGTVAAATGAALLVRDPAGHTYLASGNRRFLIPVNRYQETLRTLGWNDRQPWPVSAAWLNAVPLGPDLEPPAIPGRGEISIIDGYSAGRLVTDAQTEGGVPRGWAVVLADGVAPVTEVEARLLLALPGARAPVPAGPRFYGLKPARARVSDFGKPDGLPAAVPRLVPGAPAAACMTLPVDSRTGDGIRIDPTVPPGSPATGATVPGAVRADLVHVARGRGAVVISATSPAAPAGTVTLVTDTGTRFAVAGREATAKLGYGDVGLEQVPSQLVALLPQGPALDPAQAREPASG